MKALALVFLGGGLGSMVRYGIGKWVTTFHNHYFPFGTLIANVMACFIIGAIIGLADHRHLMSPQLRLFWTVGFCGGFSTFSAFSNETLSIIQNGLLSTGFLYVGLSLIMCVLATYVGLYLSQSL